MSYSGEPGAPYWVPGMPAPYPSPPQDRGGPPPSASAYRNMPQYHHMAPAAPPIAPYGPSLAQPSPYYAPPYSLHQTSPPYDAQPRPGLPSRNSSNYGTRNGPAPIVTQAPRDSQKYSARYGGQPQSATQARFPNQLQLKDQADDDSECETSSDEEEEYEYEPEPKSRLTQRELMPPPRLVKQSRAKPPRPALLHAHTTQVGDLDRGDRRRSQSIVATERPGRERAPRVNDIPDRRTSRSRPAAPQRQTQSAYETPRARVVVNNSRADRRRSAQIYDQPLETTYEQYARERALVEARAERAAEVARAERAAEITQAKHAAQAKAYEDRYQAERKKQQRNSRMVFTTDTLHDDSDEDQDQEEELEPAPLAARRRRPTDIDGRKGKERILEAKSKRITDAAEDYISAQRGSRDSYADQIHKAAKRASRIPSGPSDSGSSRSDKQSQSNHTALTGSGSNEIRLRVDASAPLSLSFNGDMEGRTLQLLPAENGMADIVIGGSRGGESTYHSSERGSVLGVGRKSIMANQARRDAEEMTERSSRSGRSRRDGRASREIWDDEREDQRRVLRRRNDHGI